MSERDEDKFVIKVLLRRAPLRNVRRMRAALGRAIVATKPEHEDAVRLDIVMEAMAEAITERARPRA